MEKNEFAKGLASCVGTEHFLTEEPMRSHTSFKVGGPAEYFVMPQTEEALKNVLALCRREGISFYIIGNGTNLLVSDKGMSGVVIEIGKAMSHVEINGTSICAQAGASLAALSAAACKASLTGLEFASGIPGTVGGAVYMNAGAYGGEMKDVVTSARVLKADGTICEMSGQELAFGYRTSAVEKEGGIVLAACFELETGDPDKILETMADFRRRRTEKQPLELPSAGSTFKRPEGYFAGKLIQDAGLRGYQVGDAQVSEKHCGFVVNKGAASAADIYQLIGDVQKKVFEDAGVHLEPEVRILGEFS